MPTEQDPTPALLPCLPNAEEPENKIIKTFAVKSKRAKKTPETLEEQVRTHHQHALGRSVEAGLERVMAGFYLTLAQVEFKRTYLKWLKTNFQGEFGFCIRTAQRYVDEYQRFVELLRTLGVPHTEEDLRALFSSQSEFRQLYAEFAISRSLAPAADPQFGPNDWLTSVKVLAAATATLGEIECDPCASSSPAAKRIAAIEYGVEQNGLDASNRWPGAAWVAPGHRGSFQAWCRKTLTEFHSGSLQSAILCLPLGEGSFPADLMQFPFAVSTAPLTVDYLKDEERIPCALPKRSLFIYVAAKPDVDRFAAAFSDIAVAFAPLPRRLALPRPNALIVDEHAR